MWYSRVLTGATIIGALLGASSIANAACSSAYCSQSHQVTSHSSASYSTVNNALDSQFTLAPTGYSAGSASDVPAGMCPTSCGVNVDAPAGSRVLACYAPCAAPAPVAPAAPQVSYVPTPVTTAYRVVRPVIVVPYAVPVMVPNRCGPIRDASSRYGSGNGHAQCGG